MVGERLGRKILDELELSAEEAATGRRWGYGRQGGSGFGHFSLTLNKYKEVGPIVRTDERDALGDSAGCGWRGAGDDAQADQQNVI